MPRASANGIEIEYDTFGDPSEAPLVLINGLGAQMVGWDEDFCRLLADRGFRVIRFDNRDVGRSTSPPRTSSAPRWAASSPSSWPSTTPSGC